MANNIPVEQLQRAWAAIRGLHHLLWTAHWVAEGDPQYGDHLLYQRLYEARVAEIDGIAEQLVLLGGPAAVNPLQSWEEALGFIEGVTAARQPSMLHTVLAATQIALGEVNKAERAFGARNDSAYSLGVVNLLSGIAQSLNEAVYLLKRRGRVA